MTPHFSRHEQFLRIFSLLEILGGARQPIDDRTLITTLKERLGLGRLSARTLHRDCAFLSSCGYPIDHVPLPDSRRYGWRLDREALAGRVIPAEPLTLLELVAFMVARDLLRPLDGTVIWTGIESLRNKLERSAPPKLRAQLTEAAAVFHVVGADAARYAGRPRLLSTLATAIMDRREIEVATRQADGQPMRLRIRPLRLVIARPVVRLLGSDAGTDRANHRLLDLDDIDAVQTLDTMFEPPAFDVARLLDQLGR
jgi:predicted DNA-binding transcriptional regulator YafY